MAEKKTNTGAQAKTVLNPTELASELVAALKKRAQLTFQHNVAPLKNPMQLRHLRREIARLKTKISSQEAAK